MEELTGQNQVLFLRLAIRSMLPVIIDEELLSHQKNRLLHLEDLIKRWSWKWRI